MPKTTIFDVAKLAGVSIKTVSRVVNREPNVRASTRERVEQAIAELDYRPDHSARNLASRRSHLVGLVYDDPAAYELPSAGYIINLQQGALEACRSNRFELLIHPCDYRKKGVVARLTALLEETRPAGIILAAPLSNMSRIVRAIDATGIMFKMLNESRGAAVRTHIAGQRERQLLFRSHQCPRGMCGDDLLPRVAGPQADSLHHR